MKRIIKDKGRRIIALIVAVVLLVSGVPYVLANAEDYTPEDFKDAELLADGSLENGSYGSGLAFRADSTAANAHSGFKSVYARGNGNERIHSTMITSTQKTVEGKKYFLSGWIRSGEAIENAAFIQYTAGAITNKSDIISVTTEWQYVSMEITEFPEDSDITVGIGITANVASGKSVWFDDFSLVEVKPLKNTGNISDGGFEGLIYGNEYFINDTKICNAHTGKASLRAVANGTEQKYVGIKTVTVKGGATYDLGIWARSDKELTDKAFGFTGNYFDDANQPADLTFTEEFTVNKEWKFYSLEFTAPEAAETLDINLGLYITSDVDKAGIWFDDFTLNEKKDYGLIVGGGMEELSVGDKFYSKGTVVNNEAYAGEKSLYFGPSDSANAINISFPEATDPEKTYRFSAYIKVNSVKDNKGSGADIYAKFALANGTNIKGDYYNNFRLLSGTTNGEWKYVTTTFTGAAVKFFDLYMYSDDIYIDEITLIEIEPIKLSDTGLIVNGHFEGDISSYCQGVWESDDTVYFADGHSLKVVGDASENEKFYCKGITTGIDPNARYRFSVNIKTDSISTRDGVYLYINIIGPKTEHGTDKDYGWAQTASFSKKVISTGGTKDWAKYTFILDDLPEDVVGLYAYLRMDKGVTGTAWFDNLSAVKLETGDLTGDMTTFPAPGRIDNYTNVYLEYGNFDVSYKYTLDGTDPKTSDTARLYNSNAGITITGKKTIKAYAVTGTMSESDVYTFDFVAPDLVENGKFDSKIWDDNTGNWSYNSQGYTEVSGSHNENMIMTSKEFDLKAGLSYVLSLKAKGTDLDEKTAGAYITIFDSKKGEEFGMIYNFNDKLITVDSGTTDWKTYTADIKDFEQNYDKAKVTLWYAPDKGSVSFDDIFIDVSQATEAAFSVTGYTNKLSNIYYGDPDKETIELFLLLENLTPIKVNNIKVDCLVYDIATGDIIAEQGFEYREIEANGTLTQQISMVAATYYGAFLIKTHVYDGATIDETADLRVARVPTVDTLNDYIGINTHISPSDKDYQKKTIDYVTAIGGKWIADEFTWQTCEKVKGQVIMLKEYHEFVDYCEQVGAKIRLNVKITNPLYDDGHLVYSEEGINALVNYVTVMAKTFKGRIHAYEIAGEYDEITSGSPEGTASPQIYAKILERCYKAIKAEDPDAMVIHGATLRRVDWLEQMFEAGGEPYTDALVIHPYTYWNNQSPYPTMGEWIEGFIDIAERWCPDKKIWITEYGWATAEYYANYGSIFETGYLEKTSAGNFMQMYLYSKKYPQIENIMMYDIYDDGTDITNREHNFGLLTNKKFGNLPKACYAVYPLMSNQLRDIVYEKNYDVNDEFAVFQYKLPDGKKVLAMWNLNTDDIDDRVFVSPKGFSEDAYGLDSYSNEFFFDVSEDKNPIVLGRTPKFIVASEVPETVEITIDSAEENDGTQDNLNSDQLGNSQNQQQTNTQTGTSGEEQITQTQQIPNVEEIVEYFTTEIPLSSDEGEQELVDDSEEGDEDDMYETIVRRKRRKKSSSGTPYWVWIIVAVGSVAVIGGGVLTFVLVKRKKSNRF